MNQKTKTLSVLTVLFIFQFLISSSVLAWTPERKMVQVIVTPTHADWNYKLGEQADFEVKILKDGMLLQNVTITYKIGLEKMPAQKSGEKTLKSGNAILKGIKLKVPGFLRCEVTVDYEGKKYTSWGTAGFEPGKIEAVTKMPDDFDEFWDSAKVELAGIPMDAIVTLQPNLCTSEINVYHVNLQNIDNGSWKGLSRFYGMLSVPKKPGKYPAILAVPGAGVRDYNWADEKAAMGAIVFTVGIHGIPVNMPDENYDALHTAALARYPFYQLDNKDEYYYKRVFMGVVRSIDFVFSLPEFDGENLAVTGGSQGGALSIIAAGLDKRIKYLAAFYPAMCDFEGYLQGRAGGWPHMYQDYNKELNQNWLLTTPYYDAANFARKLDIPSWFSWGYNDNVCPPTSMFAAYNNIQSPKELHLSLETQHWSYTELDEQADAWLIEKLLSNNN